MIVAAWQAATVAVGSWPSPLSCRIGKATWQVMPRQAVLPGEGDEEGEECVCVCMCGGVADRDLHVSVSVAGCGISSRHAICITNLAIHFLSWPKNTEKWPSAHAF